MNCVLNIILCVTKEVLWHEVPLTNTLNYIYLDQKGPKHKSSLTEVHTEEKKRALG